MYRTDKGETAVQTDPSYSFKQVAISPRYKYSAQSTLASTRMLTHKDSCM